MSEGQTVGEEQKSPQDAIKDIFGNKAVIEQTEKGYKVRSVLEDGIVEGGQELELVLLAPEFMRGPQQAWTNAMKLEKMTVNGLDATKEFIEIFFAIRPEGLSEYEGGGLYPKEFLRLNKTGNELIDHLLEVGGTKVIPDRKMFTGTFKKAEDLVRLFHEQGHIDDKTVWTTEAAKIRDRFLSDIKLSNRSNLLNSDEKEKKNAVLLWKEVVGRETRANRNALAKIRKLSRRARLFPVDEKLGFPRVKKAREVSLKSYLQAAGGWYLRQVSSEELAELTRLE